MNKYGYRLGPGTDMILQGASSALITLTAGASGSRQVSGVMLAGAVNV